MVAGVVEEMAFRGYMQRHLERIGPTFAILVTSAVFTLLHISQGFTYLLTFGPGIFIASVVYGHLALKSGSILPGMALHFAGDLGHCGPSCADRPPVTGAMTIEPSLGVVTVAEMTLPSSNNSSIAVVAVMAAIFRCRTETGFENLVVISRIPLVICLMVPSMTLPSVVTIWCGVFSRFGTGVVWPAGASGAMERAEDSIAPAITSIIVTTASQNARMCLVRPVGYVGGLAMATARYYAELGLAKSRALDLTVDGLTTNKKGCRAPKNPAP